MLPPLQKRGVLGMTLTYILWWGSNSVALESMVTVVEGNQKAPFSIATTLRCRGERYSFPWIAPLYAWYVPYIAECLARRHQVPFLKSLVWRNLRLNPGLLSHWRTLYSLGQWPLNYHYSQGHSDPVRVPCIVHM